MAGIMFVNEKLSTAKIYSHRSKHVSLYLQPCAELTKVPE